jgi:uncharacterized protein involved in exopolysaccharide biosynthesis
MNWSLFLRYLMDALLSIKFVLLGMLVVVMVLLGLYLALETPNYKTSWIMLLPGTERASTISLDNIGEARSNGSNAYGSVSISPKNTYKEIALSDAVINNAAKEYGVAGNAFSKPRITLIDQTPAMKFTLIGESQEELIFRAQLYNRTFHATLDDLRRNEIDRNFKGIEINLEEAKQRLSQARQDIVAYQIKSSIVSDEQFKRWTDDTEQLRAERTKTDIELASLNAMLEVSLAQLGITSLQAQALLTRQANPTVTETLKTLSEKLAELASISSRYAAQNPIRKTLARDIKGLTIEVRKLLNGVPDLAQIDNHHLYGLLSMSNLENVKQVNKSIAKQSGLIAQRQALIDSREQYLARVKNHTQGAATLADLQRAHQIAEAIFSSALAKLDTSRLDIYATYPLTQLLTQPGATIKRDRLQSKLMVVASILVYAMLALALALIQVRKRVISATKKTTAINQARGHEFKSFSLLTGSGK